MLNSLRHGSSRHAPRLVRFALWTMFVVLLAASVAVRAQSDESTDDDTAAPNAAPNAIVEIADADDAADDGVDLAPDAPSVVPSGAGKLVYLLRINTDHMTADMIDRHHYYELHRALLAATEAGADAFVIEMNTNGGALDAAMMINDRLLQLPPDLIETITWVNTRAISAGAMIALSSDHIIMTPGSSIGAALPVTQGGDSESGMQSADAKVISAVAKQMKSAAEANGHPGAVAMAMVDPRAPLEGYGEEGDILSLTDREAIELGLADGNASSLEGVLAHYGYTGARVVEPELTTLETIASFLSRSVVTSALMSIAFIALIVEIKSPGVGLPLIVSVCSFGLAMFGGFMANLAGLLEPILLVIGLALIFLEIFVVPGFGIPGISGILCVIAAIGLSMNNIPDAASGILLRWLAPTVYSILGALLGTMIGLPIVLKALPAIPYFGSMMMESPADAPLDEATALAAVADNPRDALQPGMVGVAETACRPAGIGRFGGELFDIVAEGQYVEKGQEIELRRVEGNRVHVMPRTTSAA